MNWKISVSPVFLISYEDRDAFRQERRHMFNPFHFTAWDYIKAVFLMLSQPNFLSRWSAVRCRSSNLSWR
jgi:predicted transcriptional regulator